MTRENPAEIPSPSRRALLKAAAAGGVFAVPLIASFNMDAASAQTRTPTQGVPNQPITSNMVCSNQPIGVSNQPIGVSNQPFGAPNQATGVPTATFLAELRSVRGSGVAGGPVLGAVLFEFMPRSDELSYDLIVEGRLRDFIVRGPGGELLIEDTTSGKAGKIPASSLSCGPYSLNLVYSAFAVGGSTVEVNLTNRVLVGRIFPSLGAFGLIDQG